MLTIVRDTIQKYSMLPKGGQVIAAVSGGADSMAMLHCLVQLGYRPIVTHIEHGIRGKASLADAAFVEQYSLAHGLPFRLVTIDAPAYAAQEKIGIEQAARTLRYEALLKLSQEFCCPIATAHHGDDQAETLLLHLLRGCGLKGLCGMLPVNGSIIRPLLFVFRHQIESYCTENQLAYVNDATNTDTAYTRNRVRHELLPLLKEHYNPEIIASLCRTSQLLQGDAALLENATEEQTQAVLKQADDTVTLTVSKLKTLPIGAQRRLIRKAFTLLNGIEDIEHKHVEAALQLLNGQSGKRLELCNGIGCRLSYDRLLFFKELTEKKSYRYPFRINVPFLFGEMVAEAVFTDHVEAYSTHCEYVDYDKLPDSLELRTRLTGDYIYPLGMEGKCMLKKYLIDKKIPLEQREQLVLLTSGSEVLAIIGHTVSRHVALDQASQHILKITTREKD